ncbi:maleylpyruvate isomerase family mycothiol-dependent enzyme [Actinopolyspora halophila]|uniref:maleylpyruvate isomerase family mycothiol-dependent enzyme n=1 Tax=Actinopolyspora halophila TaxID=1850 RepID=UPI00038245FA|nr:maleylpyruvate isomerase family mycothiol-dependent enzyme [Actinopolyspora halophila]
MSAPDHERYCAEIIRQAGLLGKAAEGAAPGTRVPTCPDWSLEQLVLHLGGAHRWVERIVRTRDEVEVCAAQASGNFESAGQDPAVLGAWLVEGAEGLADVLRNAGPDAAVWSPVEGVRPVVLSWARRMTHETLVHRADAELALGTAFETEPELAVDALDEWMQLCSSPRLLEADPEASRLPGSGSTVHLHATDAGTELAAEWVVDLAGESITWRRAHEKATVALRAPLNELLLIAYRRKALSEADAEVRGDVELLEAWLDGVTGWFR